MIDSLPAGERVRAEHGDAPLFASLDRLASAMDARERHMQARLRPSLNVIRSRSENPPPVRF